MPATEFNISTPIEIGEATRLDLTYSSAATARDYLFLLKNGNIPVYSCRLAADSNDDNITVEAGVKVAVELTDNQTLNYFQTTGMNYELYEKNPSVLGADFAMVLYGTIAAEDTVDPVDSDLRISPVASGYANKEIADIPVSSGLLFVRDSNGDLYYNNGASWDLLTVFGQVESGEIEDSETLVITPPAGKFSQIQLYLTVGVDVCLADIIIGTDATSSNVAYNNRLISSNTVVTIDTDDFDVDINGVITFTNPVEDTITYKYTIRSF